MNITISGNLGSGKSTVCEELKKKGYEIVSAGSVFRNVAKQLNITITQLNELAAENHEFDAMVDTELSRQGRLMDNVIFDSRLAWYFVPESFKVFLSIDTKIAAKRVFSGKKRVAENYRTVEDAETALTLRADFEQWRYKELYGVDIYDQNNYDLVVDTSTKTPEEVANLILCGYEEYKLVQEIPRLYYWYIDDTHHLHGSVTHHKDYFDGERIHTSSIQNIIFDEKENELIFTTENHKYHCKLRYWDITEQSRHKKVKKYLPDYKGLVKKQKELNVPSAIEAGNVLMSFSNFDDVMFHSLYYVKNDGKQPVKYVTSAHTGTYKDSYLIYTQDYKIDIRYFWSWGIQRFYRLETDGVPLWFENIGDRVLYIGTGCGELVLRPGERKKINKEEFMI